MLAGRPVSSLLPVAASAAGTQGGDGAAREADAGDDTASAAATATAGTDAHTEGDSGARGWPRLAGTVNLTLLMTAWAGLTDTPGEVAGHGPVDAGTCRDLAAMMRPSGRWCLTLTGLDGRAVAHACARRPPPSGPDALKWAAGIRARLRMLETGPCSHARQSERYVPPANLVHLITIRQRTCSSPGCRRAAVRCDIDHTIPCDQGRADMRVQFGAALQETSSCQASTGLAPRTDPARTHDLAYAQRPDLYHHQPALPRLSARQGNSTDLGHRRIGRSRRRLITVSLAVRRRYVGFRCTDGELGRQLDILSPRDPAQLDADRQLVASLAAAHSIEIAAI